MHCSLSWSPAYVLGYVNEIDTSNETANDPTKLAPEISNLITFVGWKVQYTLKILIDYNEQNVLLHRKGKAGYSNKRKK